MRAKVTQTTGGRKNALFQCIEVGEDNEIKTSGKIITASDSTGKAKKGSIVEVTLTPSNPAYGKITIIIQ